MKKLLSLFAVLVLLTGCATQADYQIYAEAQKNIASSKASAETARFVALQEIARTGDTATRVAAVFGLSLGSNSANNSQETQLAPPPNAADTALKWAQVLVPGAVQVFGITKNASVAINQSNNNAAVAIDTNNTMLGLSTGTVVGNPGAQLLFPFKP